MIRLMTTWMLLIGLLGAAMALVFWPGGGLIHGGLPTMAGAALLTGALMKHAHPRPANRGG